MITTDRLIMEKFVPEELDVLMEIEHAPENSRFICTNTKEEHRAELSDPDLLTLAVKRKSDKYIVGYVILILDIESEWVSVKRIAFREKGKGYGREALSAVIKYTFEDLNMNKLWLEAYTDNKVGRGLYDSIGLHVDGIRRQHHKTARGILDMMQYSMLKDEYKELKAKGIFDGRGAK